VKNTKFALDVWNGASATAGAAVSGQVPTFLVLVLFFVRLLMGKYIIWHDD